MEEDEKTVLVVDDEEPIRDILSRRLQAEGYECVTAANGTEALKNAFMHDLDIVLLDVKMPGMSGMEVLSKLVIDHPDTSIIMVTAVTNIDTAVDAMKLGAYDYLTKPFNMDDLLMRLERALERRRLILKNKEYQRRLEQRVEQQEGQIQHYDEELHRLSDAVRMSTDSIIITDPGGRIIDLNGATLKMFGVDDEAYLIGKSTTDLIVLEDQEKAFENMVKSAESGYVRNIEYHVLKKDGGKILVEASASVMKRSNGDSEGFVVVARDITERNRMEEELRLLSDAVRMTTDSVAITDMGGRVLDINEAGLRMYGLSDRADFVGKNPLDAIAPEDRRKALENMTKLVETGHVEGIEYHVLRKDGSRILIETSVSVIRGGNGEPKGLVAVARDITERRRMEENTKRAAQQWRTTFDSIHDFVSIHDRDFRITRVNRSLSNLFKMEPKEVLGRHCYELFHGSSEPCSDCPYIRTMETKIPATLELFHDGLGIYIEITTSPIFNEMGEVIDCVHIARDITERKKAQQARERLNQKLQAKVSELETFSYGIAHDLRSPLISNEGLIRLLREDMLNHDESRVKEDIRLLETSVRRMRDFLNDTLAYSRASYLVKRIKDVSFGKIVNEVLKDFNTEISLIGATVSVADEFPSVYVDESRIAQVLTNLIQNSIKYRDKTVPLKIEIGHRLSEGEGVFFVCDNGLGIDKSEAGKVFELFYRGTAEGEGSGIGLSIVKKIIEAHGGRIWIEPGQSGKGTTMCFTLSQQNGTNGGNHNGKD